MSLRKVYESFKPLFLISKGEIILESRVKPLLRASREYNRISAFFSPTLIKAIFTELTICLRSGGTVKLVVGIHDAEKLSPVLQAIDNPNPREKFAIAVQKILENDIEECLRLMDRSHNIPFLFAELVKQELIQIKFASVKRDYDEYVATGEWPEDDSLFHPKVSIFRDEQDVVVLSGSINETNKGYGGNVENALCLSSWGSPELVEPHEEEFEAIWSGTHKDTTTLPFSSQFKKLISSIINNSKEYRRIMNESLLSVDDFRRLLSNSPLLYPFSFTDVRLLPHQRAIFKTVLSRWPVKALIADEVGLGKTIEAGSVLSYLYRFTGLRRFVLLVPSNLRYQWQTEMYNLFGMRFYVFEPQARKLIFKPNNELLDEVSNVEPGEFFCHGIERIIFSWHYIRLSNEAGSYKLTAEDNIDVLLVDEAHGARLKQNGSEEVTSTKLYEFLNYILPHVEHKLLLTATPQQTSSLDYLGLLKLVSGHNDLQEGSIDRIANLNLNQVLSTQQKMDAVGELVELKNIIPTIPDITCDLDDPLSVMSVYSDDLYIRYHPTTLFTLRNTRESLKSIGYTFPHVNLFSSPIDIPTSQLRLFRLINAYVEQILYSFERNALGNRGSGFIQAIYYQRIVSSLQACYDTLVNRRARLQQIVDNWYVEGTGVVEDIEDEEGEDNAVPAGRIVLDEAQVQEAAREISYIKEIINNIERFNFLSGSIYDPKISKAMEIIKEHLDLGNQIIVFSRFTSTTNFIVDKLKEDANILFGRFQGNLIQKVQGNWVENQTRTTIAESFRRGEFPLIICSDAASEGLNLQSANVLINIDVPWNPARLLQRFGRIDRFGQKKGHLYFYNLFYPGTIEDRMYSRLHERNEDFRTVLGTTPNVTTPEHIDELLFQGILRPEASEPIYRNTMIRYSSASSFRIHELIIERLERRSDVEITDSSIKIGDKGFQYSKDETDKDYLDLNHPIFSAIERKVLGQPYPVYSLNNSEGHSFFFCLKLEERFVPVTSLEAIIDYLILNEMTVRLPATKYTENNLGDLLINVIHENSSTMVNHDKIKLSEDAVSLYNGLNLKRVGTISGKVILQ